MSEARSDSRGREFISTGRGGAGNAIRSPSRSNNPTHLPGIDPTLFPGSERGRSAPIPKESLVDRVFHTGRGGAGNTTARSPSNHRGKGPGGEDVGPTQEEEDRLEERLVAERRGREGASEGRYSTGRGGVGNMNSSRSRSRSRQPSLNRTTTSGPLPASHSANSSPAHGAPQHHHQHHLHLGGKDHDLSKSTTRSSLVTVTPGAGGQAAGAGASAYVGSGRGGYGNIISTDSMSPEQRAQYENDMFTDAQILSRWRAGHPHEITSSGRGGGGNLAPPLETPTSAQLASLSLEERGAHDRVEAESARLGRTTGHGGLGNYQPGTGGARLDEVVEEGAGGRVVDMGRGRGRQGGAGAGAGAALGDKGEGKGEGVIKKVMRSLSRQSGPRDRSAVRS